MRRVALVWIGFLVAFTGIVSYFEFFSRFPVLRDFPWVNLPMVLLGAVVSAVGARAAFRSDSQTWQKALAGLGTALALLSAAVFCWYIFVATYRVPVSAAAPAQFSEAPDFELPNNKLQLVRLSDYRGKKVALVFYRGHW